MVIKPVAVVVACMALLVGCASAPERPGSSGGRVLGEGMRSLKPVLGRVKSERPGRQEAWEPNFLYPPLPRAPGTRTGRVPDQVREGLRAPERQRDMRARGTARAFAYMAFRAYKATYSRVDGSNCNFVPTCSQFGANAVSQHGIFGIPMAFARLSRNHADTEHYVRGDQIPFIRDPLRNYTFFLDTPRADAFHRYDDPAQAWWLHVALCESMTR